MVRMRFGLDGAEPLTQREIAAKYGTIYPASRKRRWRSCGRVWKGRENKRRVDRNRSTRLLRQHRKISAKRRRRNVRCCLKQIQGFSADTARR